MSFRSRAVIVTALFMSLAGFAAQGSASTIPSAEHLLPGAASLLQLSDGNVVPVDAAPSDTLPVSGDPATAQAPAVDPDMVQPGDQIVYPTLAAAVAAQSATDGDDDLRCLAGAIYFESRGEPLAGQLAVAEVILNRAASGKWGAGACGVVTAPSQFSFVRRGHMPAAPDNADYRTAIAVARVAMSEAYASPAPHAMYFHARRVAPGWNRARIASIGNHVFYR